MIATNAAKNLTLRNKRFPRMVIPIVYKLNFFSVKINMEKKYHNSILRNPVKFNHFSFNIISELQEVFQKRHTLLMVSIWQQNELPSRHGK